MCRENQGIWTRFTKAHGNRSRHRDTDRAAAAQDTGGSQETLEDRACHGRGGGDAGMQGLQAAASGHSGVTPQQPHTGVTVGGRQTGDGIGLTAQESNREPLKSWEGAGRGVIYAVLVLGGGREGAPQAKGHGVIPTHRQFHPLSHRGWARFLPVCTTGASGLRTPPSPEAWPLLDLCPGAAGAAARFRVA